LAPVAHAGAPAILAAAEALLSRCATKASVGIRQATRAKYRTVKDQLNLCAGNGG
jgi:hypothetical protein